MKKRIFGITAFAAVLVLGLAFTACGAEERICDFYNAGKLAVTVTCAGSTPNSFTLAGAKSATDTNLAKQTVTREGKDIEITNIVVTGYEGYSFDDLIEFQGSVNSGSVIFIGKAGNGW